MNQKEEKPKTVGSQMLSVFALLGFIALILIGLWSAYQVIKFVPRLWGGSTLSLSMPDFASWFNAQTLSIVPLDGALKSGEPFTLEWKTKGNFERGTFSFAYACRQGFYFEVASVDESNATTYRVIPCNAAYSLANSDRSVVLRPVSNENRFLDVAFAITFTDEKGESIRDTITATVENGNVSDSPTVTPDKGPETETPATTTPETKPTTTQPAKTTPSVTTNTSAQKTVQYVTVPVYPENNPYGTPDLAVAIVGVGVTDSYTGEFIARSALSRYDRGAVKFAVTNNGNKETGAWTFIAQLPTVNGYTLVSDPQQSILPGGRIEFVVSFDQLAPGTRTISIHVDPQNYMYESSEYNNYGNVMVNVY